MHPRFVFIVAFLLLATDRLVAYSRSTETTTPAKPPAQGSPPKLLTETEPRFLVVEGDVKLDGHSVYVGHPIPRTALIVVGKESRAVITLEPGSVIRLGANTTASLGATERKRLSFKLIEGTLWSFFTRPTDYEVEGPTVAAGARGTAFFVEAESQGSTYVCACDGAVDLEGVEGSTIRSSLEAKAAHESQRITAGASEGTPAARQHHDDAEAARLMMLLEATE